MRILGKLFAAYVLTLTLALSTLAGDISTPLAPPQPAPAPAEAQGVISTPGDMHTTETSADVTLAGVVVDLVEGVLALL